MSEQVCLFVSDLHGHLDRYQKLFTLIERDPPLAVFLGGDLLPSGLFNFSARRGMHTDFVNHVLGAGFARLRERLAAAYPRVFLILGNDDGRVEELAMLDMATHKLWQYAHERCIQLGVYRIFGYSYIPPTPFLLKDWERYDVSRYVSPGCVSPEEGVYSVPVAEDEKRWRTIQKDLAQLTANELLAQAIILFHAPPYQTKLDRAALDGKMFEHTPLDVHVGSIAIRRFIETRQPYITLHGHIHESARLTGAWQERLGTTYCFSAAHDGPELAVVRFDLHHPECATRELL